MTLFIDRLLRDFSTEEWGEVAASILRDPRPDGADGGPLVRFGQFPYHRDYTPTLTAGWLRNHRPARSLVSRLARRALRRARQQGASDVRLL